MTACRRRAEAELRLRYQRTKEATDSAMRAVGEKQAAHERLALRGRQVQHVAAAVGAIQQQQARRHERRRRRRDDIYRHVRQHLGDAAALADEAEFRADRHWAELDQMLTMEGRACAALRQMARSFGLADAVDPDDIAARVALMSRRAEADDAEADDDDDNDE